MAPHVHNTAKKSCDVALEKEKAILREKQGIHNKDSYTFDEALAFLCENDDASEDELEEVIQNTENTSVEMKKVLLTLSYDMGWQRRSTGRRYNSLSGVGAMVGAETNKILNYGIRQKDCRKCTYYKHKKLDVPEHECATNFQGSSRAMEADLAAELIADIDKGDDTHVENIV